MKKCAYIVVFLLILSLTIQMPPGPALAEGGTDAMVRIGLYYANAALASANLANETGSGHRFGFFEAKSFVQAGYTQEEKITVLKDVNMYVSGGTYYASGAPSGASSIGAYHVDSGVSYDNFDDAFRGTYDMTEKTGNSSFVAFAGGKYRVRIGHYSTKDRASNAVSGFGLPDASVVGASGTCYTVVATATGKILFEYDGGSGKYLAIMPDITGEPSPCTWFKGYKYYGAFEYRQLSGSNLSVINCAKMDDYTKGVIPYEMNPSWNVEALKAQALCAKSYTAASMNRHSSQGFDLCNTEHCQVYRGLNTATKNSDSAVDAVTGLYILHNGKPISSVYHSSCGGATEDSENVWDTRVEYLRGITDDFENPSEISLWSWSVTLSRSQLSSILNEKGYSNGGIKDAYIEQFTTTGNVFKMTFVDSSGKPISFAKERARTVLNGTSAGTVTRSQRFNIGGAASVYVSGGQSVQMNSDLYAVGADGIVSVGGGALYVISSGGTNLVEPPKSDGNTFVFSGSGNGHNVGMSQWGAKGAADKGYTFDQIIKHYYTGVSISPYN